MIKFTIHIIAAVVLMILLMAVLSFVVILLMENNTTNHIRSKIESFRKYLCQIKHVFSEDGRSIWKGIVFFLAMLMTILAGLIALAYVVPLEKCSLWNIIEKFFIEHTVIASIVGTLVGLVLAFALLRPRLILKKAYLYEHVNHKTPYKSLSFCIKNIGLFPVNNVRVSVFWLREPNKNSKHPNDRSFQQEWKTMRIDMFRPEINSIDGIFSDENSTYSCHAKKSVAQIKRDREKSYENLRNNPNCDFKEFVVGEELFGDIILCRVQATHSLSGITKVYEWRIDANDIDGYTCISAAKEDKSVHYDLTVEKETGKATLK